MQRGEELSSPSLMELTDDTTHLGNEVVVSTSTYPWPRHLPTRDEALSGQSLACQASTSTKKSRTAHGLATCRPTHALLSTTHVFSCTTHQSCFQILFLHCHFQSMVVEVEERLVCGIAQHCRVTPVSGSSSISQILTAQLHSQHFLPHLHCYHALD